MKYLIVVGWILAIVDAIGVVVKDNGTECLIDCGPEDENKTVSYDSSCTKYVLCLYADVITFSSCNGDDRYDEAAKKCVPTNGKETTVCHPCAGLPPYIQTVTDCHIDCHANKGQNMSYSFDCRTYAECTNEAVVTLRGCPNNQTFSDAARACVQPVKGSGPTCHPCRFSEIPSTSVKNSGVHHRVDLTTKIIVIFIAMLIVL